MLLFIQTFFPPSHKFINHSHTTDVSDIPCFAEEVILQSEADLHDEITEGVSLNNIYEVALENEIYLDQSASSSLKYG
jgi:hypothetical protein